MRRALDRFVAVVARLIARGLFRSVEVVGFENLPGGPRLIVANHFNGFVDPVVIAGALGRLPRFIAKATLWRTPGVPVLMKVVGVLPVHRAADGGGSNQDTFHDVVADLHAGATVAIFPEGTTHDDQHLSPVRTGAARLALDAAADGVERLHVVPVGVTFEDKVALRSRVVVRAGAPIVPAPAAAGSDDHEAVRALTEEIRDGLAAVSPDFPTLLDAVEMRRAADVALRSQVRTPLAPVPLADREAVAKQLHGLPPDRRTPIAVAAAEYELLLGAVRTHDDHLQPRPTLRSLVTRLVTTALLVAALAPFALVGLAVNLVPTLLVVAAGYVASAPVSKGTNRVLVGFVTFPVTWFLLAAYDVGAGTAATVLGWVTLPLEPFLAGAGSGRDGFWPSLVVFLAAPALGLLAVWLAERVAAVVATARAVASTVNRRRQVAELLEHRVRLVALVEDGMAR
jgi:glycerol-3-phosphate O-acyltransferase / dihydroxyacetone phosphate acyltransferase